MLYFGCKHLASTLDTVYMCPSDDTIKAVSPLYVVSMPGEVKYHTRA